MNRGLNGARFDTDIKCEQKGFQDGGQEVKRLQRKNKKVKRENMSLVTSFQKRGTCTESLSQN